ncbi:MAG: N-acetylmuramoyl-L-alanine amidase [Candidatus Krumholzibacteriaceae bacterium]
MNRRLRLLSIISVGALLLAGCAERKPAMEGLYAGLRERPEAVDAHVLAGKIIVIDPGHGGAMNGALGTDSLREADANLGVALYLWGLCKDAGADAHLTRTTDRDLLPPGSKDPADDLKARVAMANALAPDVFLSIHHNSNLPRNRDVNDIEVYYRASDPGASLELAQALQVHLARNLGIEASDVKPANYLVLRLSTAQAAVLGEASYLSSPAVEERLKLSAKQKLEAEAYFLGLVEYFSKGVPLLTRESPARDTLAGAAQISFSVRSAAGIPVDPSSAVISLGSRETAAIFDAITSTIRIPADPGLPNGTYVVQGSVRSTAGATARSRPFTVLLARPARFILPLAPRERPGSIVALSVKVLDALGMHVADGTPVTGRSLRNGTAVSGVCANGTFTFEVARDRARDPFVFTASGVADTVRFAASEESARLSLTVCDAGSGAGVSDAIVSWGRESLAGDAAGHILIPPGVAGDTLIVSAKGYRPVLIDTAGTRGGGAILRVPLEPLFGGVFRDRKIALDPAGGGPDAGGRGAAGLRGASVNLDVARLVRGVLERAGSTVILTREGDEPLSAHERIYVVNRSNAELAIGIRHGAPPEGAPGPRVVLHYAGSDRGRVAAEKLASALDSLPSAGPFAVGEGAGLFLQQTACTACEIYCGPVEDGAREALMRDESYLRLEAERILAGAAACFGFDAVIPRGCAVKVVRGGAPAAGATVDIDALFAGTTGPDGSVAFGLIEPGTHLVAVRTSDAHSGLFMREFTAAAREIVINIP